MGRRGEFSGERTPMPPQAQGGHRRLQGGLSAENYISISTAASRATATRDLQDLVEKGALAKTGELRHTRYSLKLPS